MNYFLKANKNLITYSLIIFLIFPIFGIKFFIGILGNILLLLFLIPLFLLLLVFLGLNYYNTKINKCSNCGTMSFGFSETCMNCGTNLSEISNENQINKRPSESTIEVMAEEIK